MYYTWLSEALNQDFESVKLLKESPRGSVTLVRHRESGKKFVLRSFEGNAEVYQKLLNYTCPNLPQIYEVASEGGRNLVLEEYIQGDNMGQMLRETLFSPKETRRILRQLGTALWVLHSMGAIHRDVKPENIVLRGNEAVLIDFDAARIYKSGGENDTQVLGTIGYAAPEQYGFSQSDACSDIYSLGILMNVMLTGKHPSNQLAPGRFGRIVTRCTQITPRKRYKNILRLLDEL